MNPRYHPSDETLARAAAGTLADGPALVVGTHLAGCAACRAKLRQFEAVGGALLEQLPPTPMAADSLARALAAIDAGEPDAVAVDVRAIVRPARPDDIVLPGPLADCQIGNWRRLAPGIRFSRVLTPGRQSTGIVIYRVAANTRLPEHGHSGTEFTQVLHGTLCDGHKRFLPGDLVEADADVEHEPFAGPDGECVCLAAVDGKLIIHSLIGRMVQSLFRL